VRLECHERGLRSIPLSGGDCTPDDVDMPEMDAVEAADGEGHGSDWARGESKMNVQVSTFS